MPYKRKTEDEFRLLINCGNGWELATTETSRAEIRARAKEYRQNSPQYPVKWQRKRVPIQAPPQA